MPHRAAWMLCVAALASACIVICAPWAGSAPGAGGARSTPGGSGDRGRVSRGDTRPLSAVNGVKPAPTRTSFVAADRLFAEDRYAEAYAADFEAAKRLSPGALYRLDAVLAACQGIPRSEEQYQQWLIRHAGDESPGFDYTRKMMTSCAGVPEPTFQELSQLFSSYAEQGHAEGYYMLGLLYPFGSAMGDIWLEKAASAGSADAASQLGEVYLQRGDSEGDRAAAYKWFLLSQSLGDRDAGGRIEDIAVGLTQGDISKARSEALAALSPAVPTQR